MKGCSSDRHRKEDPSLQRDVIVAMEEKALEEGTTWFLIDSRWFHHWKLYVGYPTTSFFEAPARLQENPPGPISNSNIVGDGPLPLFLEGGRVNQRMSQYHDFAVVHADTWRFLHGW